MQELNREVQDLGRAFWEWRIPSSYRSPDDVPRVEHPPDWVPEFDRRSARRRLERAAEFRQRWESLDVTEDTVSNQVDYRLVGSAISRVEWEVDILRNWERDAVMQVHQALGPVFDLIVPAPPFDSDRQEGVIHRLHQVGPQLEVARQNLARAGTAALADAAVRLLGDIDQALPRSMAELSPLFDAGRREPLRQAGARAAGELASFREWLHDRRDRMPKHEAVGREKFVWFLRNVALLPMSPEEIILLANREIYRNYAWEEVERNRGSEDQRPPMFESAEAQVVHHRLAEQEIRHFYEDQNLLTQPDSLGRYHVAPLPSYIEPLTWLGVSNDLTSDRRLDEDGLAYVWDPSDSLPYFFFANAHDPRLGIIHEGAHYKQLALSWAHPNPLRRRYYDSTANEGIAHYNEFLMLQAGLFDDAPWSRLVIQNFKRLRSLRAVVDVSLATGAMTLEEGMRTFMELVPIDYQTALEETSMYLAGPGLAMSYMVGKLEIVRLLGDARARSGADFSLRRFHDYLWKNGNVPLSLLRWEMLDDPSDIQAIEDAG